MKGGGDSVGGGAGLFGVQEKTPEEIVKATLTHKREHYTWKVLSELWHTNSVVEQPRRPDQAQRRSGSADVTAKRPLQIAQASSKGEATTTDAYDKLYDLIMVRKDSDGVEYGRREVSPPIYGRSGFPFDDETYPKLTAALDRFSALSQAEIAAYGSVKRALMQRQLWVVFDATVRPTLRLTWRTVVLCKRFSPHSSGGLL